jgi:RND family efflux transporter MFP subunit
MRHAWIALLLFPAACRERIGAAPQPLPAAKVENPVKEGDLASVVLTDAARKRLALEMAAVELRKVERYRTLGGEAVVPPGRSITVGAPLAGTVSGTLPVPGQRVAAGQALLTFTPVLSPDARATLAASRIQAEGDVERAKVELEAGRVALGRAERLLAEKAGSQRAVDEAKASRDAAQASLKASEMRRDLLAGAVAGTLGPSAIGAPTEGVVLRVYAAPGLQVTAGAPLVEVADLGRLWIRVPVYVGEAASIDGTKEARITAPGAPAGAEGRAARPAAAPPAADPGSATADLVYEIDNADGSLRPGQRVGAVLSLRSGEEAPVVPWSAVVHDIHGGTWVYEKVADLRFARRRVEVRAVEGPLAVLARGPRAGAEIVAVGALELYSTEFFVSK